MLTTISWIALSIGILSSIIIAIDVYRHPQMMKIMNFVWPINGWFFGPFAIWAYYRWGRLKAKDNERKDERGKAAKVFLSTSHCSSGCTLGDAVGVPIVAVTGLAIAGSTLFAHYAVEFILAYGFGIIFQYFAIHPMSEDNTPMDSIKASIKADSLSLIAFEIGMFGWMAIVHYVLFAEPPVPTEARYWFMMQIAMILGFLTSYPANWWLVKRGIKEEM
ncbi:DUF4396 domain-containing protein [Salimicrobium flavidum]|uniref:DUF4396 domain-containing protein n=1 Tax=Salimicrobium flavidum TaxID=570947 RepID=A0A1N7KWP2_9BACI|nr:DUF4396 domain-containing protein [Salimicrobium flavidum]SIS65906.1 protein of unknown function [Salimicrobium flavidum]